MGNPFSVLASVTPNTPEGSLLVRGDMAWLRGRSPASDQRTSPDFPIVQNDRLRLPDGHRGHGTAFQSLPESNHRQGQAVCRASGTGRRWKRAGGQILSLRPYIQRLCLCADFLCRPAGLGGCHCLDSCLHDCLFPRLSRRPLSNGCPWRHLCGNPCRQCGSVFLLTAPFFPAHGGANLLSLCRSGNLCK